MLESIAYRGVAQFGSALGSGWWTIFLMPKQRTSIKKGFLAC